MFSPSSRDAMTKWPPTLRGKSAIPLFCTHWPFSVFILKCRKIGGLDELRKHTEAVVGGVCRVVGHAPVGIGETHEAGDPRGRATRPRRPA